MTGCIATTVNTARSLVFYVYFQLLTMSQLQIIVVLGFLLIPNAICETADEYKDIILKKHNDYRRQQSGSNMNKLVRPYFEIKSHVQ